MQEDVEEKRRAVQEAMEYAVPETNWIEAEDVLDIYREDWIALTLLQEFYSSLPEAREDWIREIRVVNRQCGFFLLVAITPHEQYLYLASSEGVELQGSLTDGYLDGELLDFFGYDSAEPFTSVCAALENLPLYEPLQMDEDVCPACHAVSGDYHELGCPVEICPWCGGQLIYCACRYEQLDLEAIRSEEELRQFEVCLNDRGRIPYAREQRPSYIGDGPETVFD